MTNKILLFGNSSSGKSTLAKHLAKENNLVHLDLDTIAWQAEITPPVPASLDEVKRKLSLFTQRRSHWVIEGCYSDIIELVLAQASEIYFMNLPIELSIKNAQMRPWEPHKYASKQEQDSNLTMLIEWISTYKTRSDNFSYDAHLSLYNKFSGVKHCITKNVIF